MDQIQATMSGSKSDILQEISALKRQLEEEMTAAKTAREKITESIDDIKRELDKNDGVEEQTLPSDELFDKETKAASPGRQAEVKLSQADIETAQDIKEEAQSSAHSAASRDRPASARRKLSPARGATALGQDAIDKATDKAQDMPASGSGRSQSSGRRMPQAVALPAPPPAAEPAAYAPAASSSATPAPATAERRRKESPARGLGWARRRQTEGS